MDEKPEKIPQGQCILYPAGFVRQRARTNESPEWASSRLFGPMLGVRKIRQNHVDPFTVMVSDQPGHRGRTLFFPHGHRLEGQPAYRWFILMEVPGGWKLGPASESWDANPEAVRIGYRRGEDEPVDQEARAVTRIARDLHQSRLNDPGVAEQRLVQMIAAGIIEQDGEEAKLERDRIKAMQKSIDNAEAKIEAALDHPKRPRRVGPTDASEVSNR